MKTVRVYPYRTGTITGLASNSWENAENAMTPDSSYASRIIPAGETGAAQQHWTWKTDIPIRAKIVGARWITRASVTGAPEARIRRYSFQWLYPDGSWSGAWTNIAPLNPHGSSMTTVTLPLSANAIDMMNGHQNSRPEPYIGFRQHFSASASLQLPSPSASDAEVRVEFVALEFDYTLPPYPYKAEMKV